MSPQHPLQAAVALLPALAAFRRHRHVAGPLAQPEAEQAAGRQGQRPDGRQLEGDAPGLQQHVQRGRHLARHGEGGDARHQQQQHRHAHQQGAAEAEQKQNQQALAPVPVLQPEALLQLGQPLLAEPPQPQQQGDQCRQAQLDPQHPPQSPRQGLRLQQPTGEAQALLQQGAPASGQCCVGQSVELGVLRCHREQRQRLAPPRQLGFEAVQAIGERHHRHREGIGFGQQVGVADATGSSAAAGVRQPPYQQFGQHFAAVAEAERAVEKLQIALDHPGADGGIGTIAAAVHHRRGDGDHRHPEDAHLAQAIGALAGGFLLRARRCFGWGRVGGGGGGAQRQNHHQAKGQGQGHQPPRAELDPPGTLHRSTS
jgi:hypothetical protein